MTTFSTNMLAEFQALTAMTPAELAEWNRLYDEYAAHLRKLMPTPAAERRYLARLIIERVSRQQRNSL